MSKCSYFYVLVQYKHMYKSQRRDLAIAIKWGRAGMTLPASMFEDRLAAKALNRVEGYPETEMP